MRSWLVFEGPIRLALHKLKYRRNFSLGEALAQQLYPYLEGLDWAFNMIVPVPLGKKRMQERGYNQVAMVALPLAYFGGWEYAPKALARVRETRSQVGLTPAERKENVLGAFLSDRHQVIGKTILLIDDVTTTGATISACTNALLESGALEIYALTLARALPHHGLQYA